MNWVKLALSMAPTVIGLVEKLHGPKSGVQKKTLALTLVQTAIVSALGIDPTAIGAPEQALIGSINDAVVAYYNAKGWPTQ